MKRNIMLVLIIFAVIFLAKFPTLYHSLNTPNNYWYAKQASWFDAWDVNAYVSYIRYGQNYGMILQNTYTTIPHTGVFVFQLYTFLGVVNRFLHIDPFLIFHLSSILMDIFLILSVYFLVRLFIENNKDRGGVFLLILLGGGLGFIPQLRGMSAEMVTPDFNFIKPFNIPHDALSILLTLLSLGLFYRYIKQTKRKDLVLAVITGLGSAVFHPYKLLWLVLVGVIAIYFNRSKLKSLILYPLFLTVSFAIYFPFSFYPFLKSPGFSGISNETFVNANIMSLLSGFGILVPFAIWAMFNTKEEREKIKFLGAIFLVQVALLFTPFAYARQFIPTIYVWAAFLSYFGLKDLCQKIKYRYALWILVIVSSLSTFFIFFDLLRIQPINNYFFLTKKEGETLELMKKLPKGSGILALYRIGNYIPAFSDNKVYFGHFYQTPNSRESLQNAQLFYTQMSEKEQGEFLKLNRIDYIYYGLEEQTLRNNFKLELNNPFPYFKIIYQNGSIIIYDGRQK